ncbi:ATP-binding protein [Pediococcus damnosus]|nr:AAA family ATPase [Pediococcus damnosus]
MMKILKINIYGFGKWQDQKFDLSQNLTYFSGPNEAGKSTLRQFILSILFGFRTKRGADRYLRYEPKDGSKYGGELLVEHQGTRYLLTRVKGKSGGKLTVTDVATQEVLSNDVLATLLGSVDETLFNEMFSFSQTELTEIRQLERDEFRKRVLKIGAVGSDQWISLQSSFEKSADKIYAPKGRVRPLNKLLKKHQKLEQNVQEASQEIGEYRQKTEAENEAQKKLTKLSAQIKDSQDKLEQLKRNLSGWSIYQQLQNLIKRDNQGNSTISTDKIQDLEKLNQQLNEIKQTATDVKTKISELMESLKSNPRVVFFDQHQEEVTTLRDELGDSQSLLNQVEDLKQQVNEIEQEKIKISSQLIVGETIPNSFTDDEMNQVQTNLDQKSKLENQKQAVQDQIVHIQNRLLEESNSRRPTTQPTQKRGLQNVLTGVGVILIIIPWLFSMGIGLKIGLALLGLVCIGIRYFMRPGTDNQTKTHSSANMDLHAKLSDLNTQLEDISKQQQTIAKKLTAIGKQKGISNSDPQTWPALQNYLKRFELLTQKQKTGKEQIVKAQKQISEFLDKSKLLSDWVVLTGDTQEKIQNLNNYFQKMDQEQQDVLKIRQDLAYYQNRFKKVTAQKEEIQHNVDSKLKEAGLNNWESFQIAREKQYEQESNQEKISKLKQQLNSSTLKELSQFENKEQIQDELTAQTQSLEKLRKEQETLIEQKTVLNTKLQQLADDDTYSNLQQELANLEAEILAQTREWLTTKLAAQWIDETLSVASQGRLPKIIKFAEQYFSLLTNKRYNKISFNDGTIVVFDTNNQAFDVGELSQGTAEQLYVAIRLAFVEVMTDLVDLPIIIDDGFVNFDATRKQNVMNLLSKISQNHQVIYFSTETQLTNPTSNSQVIYLK